MSGETFETNLTGHHNIYNLTSVLLYALSHQANISLLRKAVRRLKMVKRRQEYKGIYRGSPLIDDFAHHPRAVSLTLDTIKSRFPDKKIHAIFEPASATARSTLFQEEFAKALQKADRVTLVRPHSPTTVPEAADLDIDRLAGQLSDGEIVGNQQDMLRRLRQCASPQTVTLILSNAGVLGLWDALKKENP